MGNYIVGTYKNIINYDGGHMCTTRTSQIGSQQPWWMHPPDPHGNILKGENLRLLLDFYL